MDITSSEQQGVSPRWSRRTRIIIVIVASLLALYLWEPWFHYPPLAKKANTLFSGLTYVCALHPDIIGSSLLKGKCLECELRTAECFDPDNAQQALGNTLLDMATWYKTDGQPFFSSDISMHNPDNLRQAERLYRRHYELCDSRFYLLDFYLETHQLAKADEFTKIHLTRVEQKYGNDSDEAFDALDSLAFVNWKVVRIHPVAQSALTRMLAIARKRYHNSEKLTRTLVALARFSLDSGDIKSARKYYQEAARLEYHQKNNPEYAQMNGSWSTGATATSCVLDRDLMLQYLAQLHKKLGK